MPAASKREESRLLPPAVATTRDEKDLSRNLFDSVQLALFAWCFFAASCGFKGQPAEPGPRTSTTTHRAYRLQRDKCAREAKASSFRRELVCERRGRQSAG